MTTRLTCSQGHVWDPDSEGARVCPTCGEAVVEAGVAIRAGIGVAGAVASQTMGMPFVVLREHARGGLGLVNLARDERIEREVALKKILPEHGGNEQLKKRFLYEARITGQLEHPSIVPVYSLGSDEVGNPYYVMRFVRGRNLEDIIAELHSPAGGNPIVFRELLRRFIAVCQAVAYAHSRNVIHRDLKPSNIMLGDYGETLVLDWGLAKDVKSTVDLAGFGGKPRKGNGAGAAGGGNPELTREGQVIGTPAYMAPEQAAGRTDLHGPVTDIYALGGILYKILCGRSPAAAVSEPEDGNGERVMRFVASATPSTLKKDVDAGLEGICLRAMATDPGGRYQRAMELAQDVQRWLDEHPLSVRPRGAGARVAGWVREWAVWLVVGMGVVILGLVVALLVGRR